MNNTTTDSFSHGLISDRAISIIAIFFKLVLNPSLVVLGLCANVINIVVFYKIGLKDGVTRNFFILSVSDLVLAILSGINNMAYILYAHVLVGKGGPENVAQLVYAASLLYGGFPQSVSMITTVVIAVVRCCCVAMPLRVKFLVTSGRQLAVILVFTVVSASVIFWAFARARILVIYNPKTNRTFAMFVNLKWYEFTLFSNSAYYSGFIIVIICVVILSFNLNRSTTFREKSTNSQSNPHSKAVQCRNSGREARVVKTVVLVSIVFIICYLPTLTITLIGTLVIEFSSDGIYRNANTLNLIIMETCVIANVTVNIFIYFFFNSRYRTTFMEMFGSRETIKT